MREGALIDTAGVKRRDFISLLGGAAASWPIMAHAQQAAIPVVGFLSSRSPGESAGAVAAFRQGLRESGLVEGQNIFIAYRWAEGHYDRLPHLAADLIGLRPAALFAAGGPPSALVAKQATSTVPIIFSAVTEPVRLGLVASLNRPGGNVTGMSLFVSDIWVKTVELLKQIAPRTALVAYLINPSSPNAELYSSGAVDAASAMGITVRIVKASTDLELDEAFRMLRQFGADGLVVPNEPFLDTRRDKIVSLAARFAVPAIYTIREYVVSGGLMSYGPSLTEAYHQASLYLGRVLKGEKPADLPVQQPTKFELVINLTTAKKLGLTIPVTMLATVDEVLE